MSADSLIRSRRSLARGVGTTTRRNRRLSGDPDLQPIPARVGVFQQPAPPVVIDTPVCIPSDFWGRQSWESWLTHEWHTDLDTLRTSDGIFRFDRQAIKRMSFSGARPTLSTDPIHLCFASPTVAAVAQVGAGPNDLQFIEKSYSSRLWHPKQTTKIFDHSLIGAVERLKAITWKQGGTLYEFTWRFKIHTDAGVTAATPTCMNRTGDETQTIDRTFDGGSVAQPRRRIKKFHLVTSDGRGALELKTAPWGFMPATTRADTSLLVNEAWAGDSNSGNITDLSRLLSVGQPYHGLCAPGAITDLAGNALPKPSPMGAPRYGNTRYFKHPSPPGVPDASLLPPDYASAGYEFRTDAILGSGLDYAPGKSILPTVTSWLHVNDSGLVTVLDLQLVTDTAATTTWNVIRYDQPPGSVAYFSWTVLGQIQLTTTDSYLLGLPVNEWYPRTRTGTYDLQLSATAFDLRPMIPPGRDRTFNVHLQKYIQVESSPDGRSIAIMRGWYEGFSSGYYGDGDNRGVIATVAVVNISAAGSVGSPTVVWQYQHQYNPTGAYTQSKCHGFAFRNTGVLHLWTSTKVVGWYPPDDPLGRTGHSYGIGDLSFSGPSLVNAADLWFGQDSVYRITNNVLLAIWGYAGVDIGFGRPNVWTTEFSTPNAAYDYYATMEAGSSTGRYATWNPKTWQFAARKSGPITWV
jgi:hypothetical protein